MIEIQKVVCGKCKLELEEAYNLSPEARTPCIKCSSLSRSFHKKFDEAIELHDKIRLRQKILGFKKSIIEIIQGDDLNRDFGVWMKLVRIFDRRKNWYTETITKKGGEIHHHTSEPLNQHLGHGSDNKPTQ